jgi:predicted molibdopterin-dependent oxidoreductase YjgC
MTRLASGVRRGASLTIFVDGEAVTAFAGESVAAALLASDRRALRLTPRHRAPRGLFCAMGVCFDCLVTVNRVANVRACMTTVEDGMQIETGIGDADRAR